MDITNEIGQRANMTREFEKLDNGLGKWKFRLQADTDTREAERVCPRHLPDGFEYRVEWIGPNEFTLQPVQVRAPKARPAEENDLNAMPDAELQTRMAELSLPYNAKRFDRFRGIEALKAKLDEKRLDKTRIPQAAAT